MANDNRIILWRILIVCSFLLLSGCGGNAPDVQTMLQNLSGSYPNIWRLVTAGAYVLGFMFCLKAMYNLKIYGEMRAHMSSQAHIRAPLTYLFVGAALIFSPTMFQTINMTLFASTNVLSYSGGDKMGWSEAGIKALIGLIQLIGLISFVRGWVYIARAGEGGQPGNIAKGLTHIFGGVLAINIVATHDILANTFGFS